MQGANDQNHDLLERLRVAEETLDAIRQGHIDALIVKGPKGEQLYSIVSPDHPYQVFFENMDEAAVVLSSENTILYGNHSFFDLIGSSSENIIGTSILDFINEGDRPYFIDCIMNKKKKKSEITIISKQGDNRIVYASVFKGVWDESEALCVLFADFTQLKRAQFYIEASEAIARVLSNAPNLTTASKSIIKLLHNHLGWEVMVIWLWNKEKQDLQCFEISHIDEIEIGAFEAKTRTIDTKSKLMFSHACLSNRPILIKDVSEEYRFLRRSEANQSGLRGAIAFPFNQDSQFGGVIELFKRSPFETNIDNLMLELMSSIGIALGLYIKRLFSEQKNRDVTKALELAHNSIYSTDKQGVVMTWSAGAERMYGWSSQEMIGASITRLYPDEIKDEFLHISQSLLSGTSIEKFESKRLRRDGELIWVKNTYEKTYDFLGNVSGLIVVEQDITKERELSNQLAISKERYNSFIEITGDWIWEIDTTGNFLFSNIKTYSLLGYRPDEIIGKSLFYFLPFEEREVFKNQFEKLILEKEEWKNILIPFIHKNGKNRWLENNSTPLIGPSGELLGFRGASRDVTESKNLEKIKNEFISVVSHELRTPLTSICGALSILVSKEMTPEDKQKLISIANKNSTRLINLINDITDIERLKFGTMKFDFKKINLRDVVLESISGIGFIASHNNVEIITRNLSSDVEIMGDYWRLVQVMNNLISNAIKFSPRSESIIVSMEVLENFGRVSVQDKGPGIPKDFQSKIFQNFAQADSSIKRASGGTGLGLYISKYIIDSHGGSIQYKTKQGEGTTFFFDIPLLKR